MACRGEAWSKHYIEKLKIVKSKIVTTDWVVSSTSVLGLLLVDTSYELYLETFDTIGRTFRSDVATLRTAVAGE